MSIFGLPNIRNTCYLNTTIQCLFSNRLFSEKLKQLSNDYSSNDTLTGCLKSLLIDEKKLIHVKNLIRILQQKNDWFNFLEHNDINEFILILFEQLNQDLYLNKNNRVTTALQLKLPSTKHNSCEFVKNVNKSWKRFCKDENTWFNDMSTGLLVNQIICGNCRKIFHNFETFRVLDVQIPREVDSLTGCLENYFAKQYINEAETENSSYWKCTNCNKSSKSTKSCKLIKVPEILILSLKRFKYVESKKHFIKNNVHIDIPNELDIDQFSITNYPVYRISAMANHMGNLSGGHYNAFCVNEEKVYLADDECVQKVNEISDLNAYTIFYNRH